ncbi:MAG: flagellar biosynthesis regulator FlaF [Paracoccaceae bacterium]|nr:MAG: flagellar biosynthesis regulator FlaF [Paracoccaceae bacterium]
MQTAQVARAAYARPDAPLRDPRTVEYDIFARVTRALAEAWDRRKVDHSGLAQALHANARLWRTLAADLAEPGNALPAELRARLFYLHEFSVAHGRKVLEGTADAGVLVDINTAVMRGLRGEVTQA